MLLLLLLLLLSFLLLAAPSAFAPAAMSMSRFLYCSSSLFESDPLRLSKHEVSEITTYSARRVLPSIADAAGLSVTERLAVGGWSDSAPDGSSMSTHARRMAMPIRYSERKLVAAASIRAAGRNVMGWKRRLSGLTRASHNRRLPAASSSFGIERRALLQA